MKTSHCNCVGHPTIFFESTSCNACGKLVGITDDFDKARSFEINSGTGLYYLAESPAVFYKKCSNYSEHAVCNGMVQVGLTDKAGKPVQLCFGCRFNEVIPNLEVLEHIPLWQKMEMGKRRALYTLKSLGLSLVGRAEQPESGLEFNFLVDSDAKDHFTSPLPDHEKILTGHDNGKITINLAEADDVARTKTRMELGEQYRTILGHFRHELGHYFFDQIIAVDDEKHKLCKLYFGDDEQSYEESLERHYKEGPPPTWRNSFISEYATMHPWEDWAETWAHYMHITDALETLRDADIPLYKVVGQTAPGKSSITQGPFGESLDAWMKLSVVLNSLNRSMGLQDAYPFVLTAPVRDKLTFIHHAIHNSLASMPVKVPL
jgi:hypothetical protein